MSGKGSRRRAAQVSRETLDANWAATFGQAINGATSAPTVPRNTGLDIVMGSCAGPNQATGFIQ